MDRGREVSPERRRFPVRRFPVDAIAIAWAVLAFLAPRAGAALRAYEGFDYTPGSLLDKQNGGSGFASRWSEPPVPVDGSDRNPPPERIASGSLAFGPLITAGHRVVTAGEFSFDSRDLSLTPTGGVLYASFLLRRDTDGNGGQYDVGDYGGVELDGTGTSILFGDSADNDLYSIEIAGTGFPASSRAKVVTGATAFLVARVAFNPSSEDISLYVNPAPGRPEPSVANVTRNDLDLGTLTGVGISSGTNATWSVDEIRLGDTYDDVTPAAFVPKPGDANLDGAVDYLDFQILYANFDKGSTWPEGDFNGDGQVNFVDFQILERNFTAPPTAPITAVPEPAAACVVPLILLATRRRRSPPAGHSLASPARARRTASE
jgi:Dockerin type I domain